MSIAFLSLKTFVRSRLFPTTCFLFLCCVCVRHKRQNPYHDETSKQKAKRVTFAAVGSCAYLFFIVAGNSKFTSHLHRCNNISYFNFIFLSLFLMAQWSYWSSTLRSTRENKMILGTVTGQKLGLGYIMKGLIPVLKYVCNRNRYQETIVVGIITPRHLATSIWAYQVSSALVNGLKRL